MQIKPALKSACLVSIVIFLCSCSAVEGVHNYFNADSKEKKAAESESSSESVVYIVKASKERLSDISFKLTGNRDTTAIKKANPKITAEVVSKGETVRIPISLLKSNLKTPAKTPLKDPVKQGSKPSKTQKQIKKIQLPDDIEILPGDEVPEDKNNGVKDNYYDTPFKNDDVEIVPYATPKPAVNNQELEEKKLRDKYKELMQQLE